MDQEQAPPAAAPVGQVRAEGQVNVGFGLGISFAAAFVEELSAALSVATTVEQRMAAVGGFLQRCKVDLELGQRAEPKEPGIAVARRLPPGFALPGRGL